VQKTHVIVFEAEQTDPFYPLSLSHPVFDLLAGTRTNLDRIRHHFNAFEIYTFCRPYLPDLYQPLTAENIAAFGSEATSDRFIFLDGSAVFRTVDRELIQAIQTASIPVTYVNGNSPVATILSGSSFRELSEKASAGFPEGISQALMESAGRTESVEIMQFGYIWDPMRQNAELILSDFEEYYKDKDRKLDLGDTHGYQTSEMVTGKGVRTDAASVVDARGGPIILEDGVEIKPMVFLEGPAFIGKGSQLVGGKLTGGCSIGSGCRIGGEVEASVFIRNTNKYHEGFIGHAYVGEWVNLGALTTNSDLANNYSEIKVRQNGVVRNTGSIKIGSFIGDHTKIGIGMTLNTGAVIGFSCNLFGGSLILEKEIPSFAWGNDAIRSTVRLKNAVRTAEIVTQRRDKPFKDEHSRLFEHIFNESKKQRTVWGNRKKRRAF